MGSRIRIIAIAAALALAIALPGMASTVGYDIQITTGYGFTNPFGSSTFLGGGTPSPDTGFVEISNLGSTTFTGNLGTIAMANNSSNDSFSELAYTLAPGASVSIAIGPEGSNQGGFNGTNGVQIFLTGLFNGTESVNLSVFDSNIHSGVFRTGCDGISSDSYVLQGGAPTGCDNGDTFETSQAMGTFTFFESGGGGGGVPEPGSLALMGTGLASIFGLIRRKLTR